MLELLGGCTRLPAFTGPHQDYPRLVFDRTERHHSVMSAKPERIRQAHDLARGKIPGVGHHIQVDLRVLILQVNRAGRLAVVQSQHSQHCLQCARSAQQMPGH